MGEVSSKSENMNLGAKSTRFTCLTFTTRTCIVDKLLEQGYWPWKDILENHDNDILIELSENYGMYFPLKLDSRFTAYPPFTKGRITYFALIRSFSPC